MPAASLQIYRSHRQEPLVAQLAADIRAHLPPSPLHPIELLVGSRGMDTYLRRALGEHLGIACNLVARYLEPTLVRLLGAQQSHPTPDPWAPDQLAWAVASALQDPAWTAQLPEATRLALLAQVTHIDRQQLAFARAVADLIDRYLHDRPQWFVGPHGLDQFAQAAATAPWQHTLYLQLQRQLGQQGDHHYAARIAKLLDQLRQGGHPKDLHALYVFGLTRLPPTLLQVLQALSQQVPVRLYLLAATADYLGDLVVKGQRRQLNRATLPDFPRRESLESAWQLGSIQHHPLLASLGRLSRDTQALTVQTFETDGEWLHDQRPPADTVLATLQADLAANLPHPPAERALWRLGDKSLQVHACYGAARQVEALRDALLHLFAADPMLKLRDVLVMTPNLQTFAPLVQTILPAQMAQPGTATPALVVTISDLGLRATNPVADALLRVLALSHSRMTASAFDGLLALTPVQQRFGLQADEVLQLRTWMTQAGVRWAMDATERQAHDQPADMQNTFERGLQRLALGVTMADDGAASWMDQVLPMDDLEGSALLLGKLVALVRTLQHFRDQFGHPAALSVWQTGMLAAIEELTALPAKLRWLQAQVRQAVLALGEATALYPGLVSSDAVLQWMDGQFALPAKAAAPIADAITLCAMQPMRAVPHQVICLLGLDDDAFPRRQQRPGHDLLALHPQVGDRDGRDEDRHMLLEALLSARRNLLLFYSGRHVASNKVLPAAVPVAELLDVLDQRFALDPPLQARCQLPSQVAIVQHPLQPFGVTNFAPGALDVHSQAPWSFDGALHAALSHPATPAQPLFALDQQLAPATLSADLPLHKLLAWLRNPSRALLQTRLGLYLQSDTSAPIADREALELDGREKWALADTALQQLIAGGDAQVARSRLRALGDLPLGQAGEPTLSIAVARAEAVRAWLDSQGPAQPPQAFAVPLQGPVPSRLLGTLDQVRNDELVLAGISKPDKPDKRLAAWVTLLAASSGGLPYRRAVLVGTDDEGKLTAPVTVEMTMDDAQAHATLQALVDLYRAGLHRPVPLFEYASWACVQAMAAGKAWLSAADTAWMPKYQGGCDSADPDVATVFGTDRPSLRDAAFVEEFQAVAATVYGPLAGIAAQAVQA